MNNSGYDIFIERAKNKYGDTYDYSKVEYKNIETNVIIICKIHGEFLQTPYYHIKHDGCRSCNKKYYKDLEENKKKFIEKSVEIYGNLFDYSNVKYVNSKTDITVSCKQHGDFVCKPCSHLRGVSGCEKCHPSKNKDITTEDYIKKAKNIHGSKYEYDETVYTKMNEKIKIKCKLHGDFEQRAAAHINQHQGCPRCKESKGERLIENLLNKHQIEYEKQKRYSDCKGKRNTLPFDFYIPYANTLIEYDGEQHYNPFRYRNREVCEKKLKDIQIRDAIKTGYCKSKGIPLIRIRYTAGIEEIENIIYSLKSVRNSSINCINGLFSN